MARRLVNGGDPFGGNAASDSVDAFARLSPAHAKRKSKGKIKWRPASKVTLKQAITMVERRLEKNDWTELTATTMMQVWVWCHRQTYDVLPGISPSEWELAVLRVGLLCKREFRGDFSALLEFVRWVWQREEGWEKWRRDNGRSGSVMGWKKQFGPKVLVEYRIEKARGTL